MDNELAKLGTPKRAWPLVVIDESHRIRNPNSQQGQVCRQIAAAADFTLYMSATAGQAPHAQVSSWAAREISSPDSAGDSAAARSRSKASARGRTSLSFSR